MIEDIKRDTEQRMHKTVEALKLQIDQELADAQQRVKALAPLLESYSPEILKRAEDNGRLVENGYRQGQANIVCDGNPLTCTITIRWFENLVAFNSQKTFKADAIQNSSYVLYVQP